MMLKPQTLLTANLNGVTVCHCRTEVHEICNKRTCNKYIMPRLYQSIRQLLSNYEFVNRMG